MRAGIFYQVVYPSGVYPVLFTDKEQAVKALSISCYSELYAVQVNARGKVVRRRWVDQGCDVPLHSLFIEQQKS